MRHIITDETDRHLNERLNASPEFRKELMYMQWHRKSLSKQTYHNIASENIGRQMTTIDAEINELAWQRPRWPKSND